MKHKIAAAMLAASAIAGVTASAASAGTGVPAWYTAHTHRASVQACRDAGLHDVCVIHAGPRQSFLTDSTGRVAPS